MRFLLIHIIILSVFFDLEAQNTINQSFKNFTQQENFKNASIGLIAVDVKTGIVLGEINSNLSLIPASTQKIVTTATALETFGENHTFSTQIMYSGFIDSVKILHGNIIIKGGGDPTLGSENFKNESTNLFQNWANEIKKLGIECIDGKIIGDDSFFENKDVPSTWIWGDIGNYYGAFASGLSIYENLFDIVFAPSDSVNQLTKIAKINPQIPNLEIENNVKSSSVNKDLAFVYGVPFQNFKKIEGTIPKSDKEFTIKASIPNPALVVEIELQDELKKNGIKINNNIYENTDFKIITETKSANLQSIIKHTNLVSNNLFAEHLALQIGKKINGKSNYESSTNAIKNFWKSKIIDVQGMNIYDGSGLSRYDAITAKQMVNILLFMAKSKNFDAFYSSLPIAGKSGTLSNVCKGEIAENRVHAKSGTLDRIRNYAGYLTTISGKEIAFVIFLNNFNGSVSEAKSKIEILLNEMVKN